MVGTFYHEFHILFNSAWSLRERTKTFTS